MRKWRPFDVQADDEWAVYHQTVVPKSYRHEILSIAHESPMSGHLGINKTITKLLIIFIGLVSSQMSLNIVKPAIHVKW